MNITKQILATLKSCYAVNGVVLNGRQHIVLASEADGGSCVAWKAPDYTESHTIWSGPGGTMSIVPIPGTDGEFLAVQQFFRMYDWEDAKIVHVRPTGAGTYDVKDILPLPYVHRFDLLTVNGRNYFIACTLARKKKTAADWANPGSIWVGEYTSNGLVGLRVLKEGLTKNHGYSRQEIGGVMRGWVTCEEGAFEVTPPTAPGTDWTVRQFMDWPISDISAIDIDGDGELEFATIESFHGKYFRVYKMIGGAFAKIYEHPEVTEFYHVVVGAKLAGKPVFVGGCRRGKQQLFYVNATQTAPLQLAAEIIDEGVGPSNACVLHEAGRDIIAVANRETDEAALYIVTP